MKGDFTRFTFDPRKHYSSVLMQQGRVVLDADWNEQADIQRYIRETEVIDVVGRCGSPIDSAGFKVEVAPDGRDLILSSGRIYVNGILCELDEDLGYFKDATFPSEDKVKLSASDVDDMDLKDEQWVELSVRDDLQGEVHEQVLKIKEIDAVEGLVLTFNEGVKEDLRTAATSNGLYIKIPFKLEAQPDMDVKTSGTYLAYLEVWNRHITAVEDDHILEKALSGPDTTTRIKTEWSAKLKQSVLENVSCREASLKLRDLIDPGDSSLAVRLQPVQKESSRDPCLALSGASYRGLENQLYRVEIHKPGEAGKATFKWSRDNGAIAFAVADFISDESEESETPTAESDVRFHMIKLRQLGWDQRLRINKNDCIEVLGDETELLGETGTLARVEEIDESAMILTLTADVTKHAKESNPKVRRWDMDESKLVKSQSIEGIPTETNSGDEGWIELENGIEVRFKAGDHYQSGDFWLIPARNTGDIEWPQDEDDFVPKFGIQHYGCLLAILSRDTDGAWKLEKDCLKLFPPLSDMVFLFYVGGDGQEAMPGDRLPAPFEVRVSRGERPVVGAEIAFEIIDGQGVLDPASGSVHTGKDGIARCRCRFNDKMASPNLRARAMLIDVVTPDENGDPSHPSIIFNANASVAEQVAYVPPKECLQLDDAKTVRDAINSLCRQVSFSCAGGDGQEAMPGNELPGPFRVRVARGSYPIEGAIVKFKIEDGEKGTLRNEKGETGPELDIPTSPEGIATCFCTLKADATIEAKLIKPTPTDQSPIWFNANVSVAEQVAYVSPKECLQLDDAKTVRDAIDGLCRQVSFAYAGGDGQEAMPGKELSAPFSVRVSRGSYPIEGAIVKFKIDGNKGTLRSEKDEKGPVLDIPTRPDGIAICFCTLKEDATIEAKLIKPTPTDQSPIWFNANVSVAEQVAYVSPKECLQLDDAKTVRDAINGLCRQVSFSYAGGDGQEAISDKELSAPFSVRVSRGSYPIEGAIVKFKIDGNKGTLRNERVGKGPELDIPTDPDGMAICFCTPKVDATIEAKMIEPKAVDKSYIRFFAGVSNAQKVGYLSSPDCKKLDGAMTVQDAIDRLCLQNSSTGKMLTTWVHGNSLHLQTTKEEKIVDISPRYDDRNGQVAVVEGEKGSSSKICFSIPVTMDPNNKTLPTAVAAVLRARANEKLDGMIYISDGETAILEGKIAISNNWENIRFALADKSISLGIGITLIINFSSTNEIWFSAAGCTIKSNF